MALTKRALRRRTFIQSFGEAITRPLLSKKPSTQFGGRYRLAIAFETLERRVQLSTVTWITAAGGDWDTPGSWSTGQLPGAGDDVVIPALNNGAVVTFSSGGDTVHSMSSSSPLTLSGGTLTVKSQLQMLSGTTLSIAGGTLSGATVASGSVITLTNAGGVLDAVTIAAGATIDGTEATTSNLDQLGITNSLTLDGTLELGNASGSVGGQILFNRSGSPQAQTLAGDGTVLYGSSTGNAIVANGYSFEFEIFPCILTIASGITIHGGDCVFHGSWQGDTTILDGTVISNTAGDTVNVHLISGNGGVVEGFQSITAANGGGVLIPGSLQVGSTSSVTLSADSSMTLSGNLLGTTQQAVDFDPAGVVTLDGSGISSSPQLVEAMSADLGPVASGFASNFAYGKLIVGPNDDVELVNQSVNSPASSTEAVYADSVVVPLGSTLNLDGLHLYARAEQIDGTVTGGTITLVPENGLLSLGTPVPGEISSAGRIDKWTFYGHVGDSVDVSLDPGSGALDGPISPSLGWADVELLDPSNNVIASASDSTANAVLNLNNVSLTSSGTYTIAIRAASSQPNATGNYVIAGYDVTAVAQTLNIGQDTAGSLVTPYSQEKWTFSASANAQVQFDLLAATAAGLNFSLKGPNGFSGFANLAGSSSLITLPTAGTYTLTAQGAGAATGSFSFEVTQTPQATLTFGTTYDGAFSGSGEPQLFVVNVPTAEPIALRLVDQTSLDHVELYARLGEPPTRGTYDYVANGAGALQSLVIPSAAPGTWYVLAYAESVVTPPSPYALVANASPVVVATVSPVKYGTNAVATLTLTGAGFSVGSSVELVAPNGTTTYPVSNVAFDTFTQLTATINLTGVPQGTYSIQVTGSSGGSSTLPAAFMVTAAGQANLVTHLVIPSAVGRHESSTFYVEYSNTGTVAMPAPLLLLESSVTDDLPLFTLDQSLVVSGYWTSSIPEGYSNTVEILASGRSPGILGPGESVTVPVYYAGMEEPWNLGESQFNFDIRVFNTSDTDLVDWGPLQSTLQPAGVPANAWSTIYGSLVSQLVKLGPLPPKIAEEITEVPIGPLTPGEIQLQNDYAAGLVGSWGGYVALLDQEANYLGQLGEDITDVNSLWGLAVQQADNALSPLGPTLASATDDSVTAPGSLSLSFSRVFATSIDDRDTMGPLGLGWSTPWQTTAEVASDGTVTITGADGAQRVFEPDSRTAGAYFSQPGDTGTLIADGHGGYLLTEAEGTQTDYASNGSLDFMQDTNGNRITAGYTGDQLTSLTKLSGQYIEIAYNSAGLISSITDSDGRTTTYSYDVSNQHLTSVTGYNGQTTTYAYSTSSGSAALNALTSITFPGGTHQYFTYDSQGRVSSTSTDGGAQAQLFAYSLGQVSTSDGTGDTSSVYYNEQGLVVKSVDALGNVTLNTYDSNFNLVKVTNALGESEAYTYNAAGEVTSSTDFLGDTTYFAYSGSLNDLSSMTDANGNKTSYSYNSDGDLLNTRYADGTSSSSTYDPEGDATSFLNANGQPINYTYNSAGQVLTESFSDGSTYTYTYDRRGNILTAKDSTGTTTFSYDPPTELLTEVAYPGGMFLKFTYNAAGQRTSMVDQTGFTTDYVYDAVGRLSQLTDGSGNAIVTYTYDADGRLSEKVNGNGTYTTYQYDADGNVLHLINYAPDGSFNSRFDYTYNAVGLETTEATLDGTWTYSYDADGQLTHAVFASMNPDVSNQDLAYAYDAMGNRITTVIDGATTLYVTDDMNVYTSVGGVGYKYDAIGNMLSDGASNYSYNPLNQLIEVAGQDGSTSYEYNALGQQTESATNGQATQLLNDPFGGGNIVETATNLTNSVTHFEYGSGLIGESSLVDGSTQLYYFDFDAAGSTVGITNSQGASVNSYSYLPYGEVAVSTVTLANHFQYIGQWGVMQTASDLNIMGARDYSSTLGQFLNDDPIGLLGGEINLRSYARNNPLTYIDPTGLQYKVYIPNPAALRRANDAYNGYDKLQNGSKLGQAAGTENLVQASETTGEIVGGDYGATVGGVAGTSFGFGFGVGLGLALDNPVLAIDAGEYFGEVFGVAGEYAGGLIGGDIGGFLGKEYGKFLNWLIAPTPPGGDTADKGAAASGSPVDPNAMIGPAGYGMSNLVADSENALSYQIDFENAISATAPAQAVTIADQLDPDLDWSTFQLTGVGWGDTVLAILAGSQYYETTVSMTYDDQTFEVLVQAGIHTDTGEVYATFQSLDPNTQLPPNVLVGFLPPEDGTGRGRGYISFLIRPKAGLPTGIQIRNVAQVTFDQNMPIATDQVDDEDPTQGIDPSKQALVIIDSGAPTSSVAALPSAASTASFNVTWSGQDDAGGSGVHSYDVYVSDNSGPYTIWQSDTTQTSATFDGLDGHSYAFYSVATDNVGNQQPTPTSPQAQTTVTLPAVLQFSTSQFTANFTDGSAQITLARTGSLLRMVTITLSSPGSPDVAAFRETVSFGPKVSSEMVTIPILSDQQPGESDLSVPLLLSTPGPGASAGSTTSATLLIHDNIPLPPPVTIKSARLETEKIGKGKKAKKETVIVLTLSGALNSNSAQNPMAFRILTGKTKRSKLFFSKPRAPKMVTYDANAHTLTLEPAEKLTQATPEELSITGSLISDTFGRALDGNSDGQPGGDFTATVIKNHLKIANAAVSGSSHAAAVDALLVSRSLPFSSLAKGMARTCSAIPSGG